MGSVDRILLTSLGLSDSRDDTTASRVVPKRHKSDDSANESEPLYRSNAFRGLPVIAELERYTEVVSAEESNDVLQFVFRR